MPTGPDLIPASARIDELLGALDDWRGELLRHLRDVIRTAVPEVTEDLKWAKATNPTGVPTWSHDGIICTGELYKDKVKLTFFDGAALPDPKGIFNSSLEASTRRAIDFGPTDKPDDKALAALIKAAAKHNTAKTATKRR